MQEAVKKSDLVTGTPFEEIGREIASTLGILEKFDSELRSIAKTMNGELATAQKKTVQDINAINQAEIESEKLLQQKLRTEKLQLDLRQKQERMAKQAQTQAEKDARTTATQIRNQERLNSVYSRVDQKMSAMVKTYRDLAIRKELGVKLSNEEQRSYDYLQAKIQKYDNALKTVDATMGKHQRNVGNYAMANSQLNFSVTQLAREMPAFANSVQTGFMAISNNLPMFFDEIGKLKKANVELRAQGEPTKNVFKSLAGSLMSTQVLLSVGVTLLTVYLSLIHI
jgi:chromosome segregation ATPase